MRHKEPPRVAYIAALIASRMPGDPPYRSARIADSLTRTANTLRRAYEQECNGYQDYRGNWDEAAATRAEKRIARLRERAEALLEAPHRDAGFSLRHQRDPRGPAIRLMLAGQEHAVY